MVPAAIKKTVAERIKAQTFQAHEDLEQLLMPRLQAIQSAGDYAVLLKSFYAYYKPLEKKIETYIDKTILPDIRERRKADLILEDLASLRFIIDVPLYEALPAIQNAVQALGALYVLEGSTLGGRGITKMLQKSVAGLDRDSLHFFSGYGERTGSRWKAFIEVLNHFPKSDGEIESLITTADQTFTQFKNLLQPNSYE